MKTLSKWSGSAVATRLIVVLALCAAAFVAVMPSASAEMGLKGVRYDIQGLAGKCVDVPGGVSADGVQLQLYRCNGTPAQIWKPARNKSLQALGKCMDVAWASRNSGAKVQLAWCNSGPAQQWVKTRTGLINPNSGKCLDVRYGNRADGALLQIWDCHGGANQRWRFNFTLTKFAFPRLASPIRPPYLSLAASKRCA